VKLEIKMAPKREKSEIKWVRVARDHSGDKTNTNVGEWMSQGGFLQSPLPDCNGRGVKAWDPKVWADVIDRMDSARTKKIMRRNTSAESRIGHLLQIWKRLTNYK
jgi:hypothetical protein